LRGRVLDADRREPLERIEDHGAALGLVLLARPERIDVPVPVRDVARGERAQLGRRRQLRGAHEARTVEREHELELDEQRRVVVLVALAAGRLAGAGEQRGDERVDARVELVERVVVVEIAGTPGSHRGRIARPMAFTLASSVEHDRRRHALARCGLDRDLAMVRGPSYANEVWIGDAVVLRINPRGVGRLAREARIVALLPREALYPEILAVGDDGELEWMLSRRVPGVALGRAWLGMPVAHRERAIHEFAGALAAIHATPCAGIPDDIRPPHTLPLEPLLALVEDIRERGGDPGLLAATADFVRAKWSAFDDADRGLVHGDPHLENVLWDGERISAVLDLECARPSWIHADLEILLAVADHPRLFASADYELEVEAADYAELPGWLAAAQPGWFAHPRALDRLEVLHVSRTLGCFEDSIEHRIRWDHLRAAISR
jgi:aminoglycoside phosphotransferase (APT) family kinase protein